MKRVTIGVTYSETIPESAEHGDFSDTGWELETCSYERGDLRSYGRNDGHYQASDTHITARTWWASDWQCVDYRTGTERETCLHVGGITDATARRIHRYLNRQPVLGGKKQ